MKIRTDFVTNSSSANYIVGFELVSGDDRIVRLRKIESECSAALIVSFGKRYPVVSKSSSIESLCEMLFENIKIEYCYYGTKIEKNLNEGDNEQDDEDWEEYYIWDDATEPRNYTAKDLYPRRLAALKKECKDKGISLDDIKQIIVRETIYASGDDPIFDEILDGEYGWEKCILTIYDANKQAWQRIAMIEDEDEDDNYGFLVLEQGSGKYRFLSPKELGVTDKHYKKMSVSEALDKWAKLQGII